jgi:hypothetical protein
MGRRNEKQNSSNPSGSHRVYHFYCWKETSQLESLKIMKMMTFFSLGFVLCGLQVAFIQYLSLMVGFDFPFLSQVTHRQPRM